MYYVLVGWSLFNSHTIHAKPLTLSGILTLFGNEDGYAGCGISALHLKSCYNRWARERGGGGRWRELNLCTHHRRLPVLVMAAFIGNLSGAGNKHTHGFANTNPADLGTCRNCNPVTLFFVPALSLLKCGWICSFISQKGIGTGGGIQPC